jgi:5-(carboxyamino)imidazole ribonucleotide synthase
MVNLLGDIWFDGPASEAPREPAWREVLAEPRAKLHLYGKAEARRGRKMGHVTCLGTTLDDALHAPGAVKRTLSIPGADAL